MSLPISIPVLMYHHVAPNDGGHCVHPERLRQQLAWLREHKIEILSGEQFRSFHEGAWQPSAPAVLLTFDDGWLDNWVYALPILKEFDAAAVFFVVTSWPGLGEAREQLGPSTWQPLSHAQCMKLSASGERDQVVMRWSELRSARDTGLVELHSHSHSHGAWWQAGGEGETALGILKTDLARSREELQVHCGAASEQLCWPRGEFTSMMQTVATQAGFVIQHSTMRGANESRDASARVVRRLHVENKPIDWFASRLRLYSRAAPARVLGWCHQSLQRARMRRRYPSAWAKHGGLGTKWWHLV